MLSVLMTVYEKEQPQFFRESLESIRNQTFPADEVVLVKDGLLSGSLEGVISEFLKWLPIRIVVNPKPGRCEALGIGVDNCRGDTVAIMDSDDICLPSRFVVQVKTLRSHPEVDVLGSAIAEFMTDPMQPYSVRRLPSGHEQIVKYAKRRSPINQMSVTFRRDSVLRAGNYQHAPGFEDWHLWNRMIQAGSRFMNLEDVLVLARVGNGMFKRRSGLQYVKDEVAFHRDMHRANFLSSWEMARSLMLRVPIRIAPESVIQTVYSRALRSEV